MIFLYLSKALDMHIAVGLLRMTEGLDYENVDDDGQDLQKKTTTKIRPNQSFSQLSQGRLFNYFSIHDLIRVLSFSNNVLIFQQAASLMYRYLAAQLLGGEKRQSMNPLIRIIPK